MLISHLWSRWKVREDAGRRNHAAHQAFLHFWLRGRPRRAAPSITHWKTGLRWILLREAAGGKSESAVLDTKTASCGFRETPLWRIHAGTETDGNRPGEPVQICLFMAKLLWRQEKSVVWRQPGNSMCLWKRSYWKTDLFLFLPFHVFYVLKAELSKRKGHSHLNDNYHIFFHKIAIFLS